VGREDRHRMPLLARGAAVPVRPGKLARGNLSQLQPCVAPIMAYVQQRPGWVAPAYGTSLDCSSIGAGRPLLYVRG
jgi:hypothetical protein